MSIGGYFSDDLPGFRVSPYYHISQCGNKKNAKYKSMACCLKTKGHIGDIPLPLKSFLHYIETNEATDDYTREIDKEVIEVRNDDKWRDDIMTMEQLLKDCAYDTELKTTERVTKEVTEQVTKKVTNEYIFNMLEQNLSDELICKITNLSEDQLAAYKEEYDKQKYE